MRVKRQKRHRKVVSFYSACFGFREPYKVLCDGTFIHHLLLHRLIPADDAISRLLASRATLFATECVVAELRCLGESHAEAFQASQQLLTARCDHEKRVNAASCIESVIEGGNGEHFFVATQDAQLRNKLQHIPGVPLIFGLKNTLFIEKPSNEDRNFVKVSEGKRLQISNLEADMLRKRKLKGILPSGDKIESSKTNDRTEEAEREKKNTRKNAELAHRWQFKRKMAKGPNPLSCKKKRVKQGLDRTVVNKDDGSGMGNKKKRNRKRKRGKPGATGE